MSRGRNHNNNNSNNNNNTSTNNNNLHAPGKRVLTVNVEAANKKVEELRQARLGPDGVAAPAVTAVAHDETDVPPSPPVDETKTFKSAFSQKIKYGRG